MWLWGINCGVFVRARRLTKHPLRPRRTRPQTDKCHRWTSPSVLSQLSPLHLRRSKETEEKMWCLCHVLTCIKASQYAMWPKATQEPLHSAISLNNPHRNCLLHPFPLFPSFLHPLLLPPSQTLLSWLSSITPKSPLIFLESRFYFIEQIFFHAASAATPRWQCGHWRQAYGGLGTPSVHITPHERPRGRRKRERKKKKKQSGQSQIAFSYHRGLLQSLHAFALLLFPPRPSSPLDRLYF